MTDATHTDPATSPPEPKQYPLPSDDSPGELATEQPVSPDVYLKKGRGRPTNDGSPSKSDRMIPIPVPSPPYRKFNSGAANRSQYPSQMIKWHTELPKWAKDRLVLYVEREWPILIKITKEDKAKAKAEGKEIEHNYIDKLLEPPEKIEKLLDMYGAGDYKLTVNDVEIAGGQRTIAEAWVKENWRDIRSYPPTDRRIDNVESVDLTDPSNRSYVEFLRAKGKLPEQGRNAEMAEAASVTREVTGVLGKVLDKVLDDKARDKGNNDTTATVVKEIMGVMGEVNKQAATVMKDAYQRSQEGVSNPMEAIKGVVEVIKELRPEQSSSNTDGVLLASFMTEIREMNKTIIGIQNDRIKFAEQIAMEAKNNKTENQGEGGGANGSGGLVGSIDTILAVAGKLGLKFAGGGGGGEAAATGWKDLIPDILSGVNSLLSTGVTAWQTKVYADQMERARAMGQNVPPPNMPIVNPPPPPAPRAQALAEAPPAAPGEEEEMNFIKFMEEIKRPLLNHINRSLGGAAFAQWMIDTYDEATYDQVREQGKDTLIMALRSYPPIAKELVGKDSLLDKFAEEFCKYAEEEAGEDKEG